MMTDSADSPSRASMWTIWEANPKRSLVLCAVGAVVGLLVAGFGLFTAQGTRTFVIPPEDAAIVNTIPILMTDYVGQVTAAYDVPFNQVTKTQRQKILADMIREELYVQRGVELGLPADDSDVRQALVAGTEAVVSQDALTEQPSEADLRGYYDAHGDTYASEGEMTLKEFVLPSDRAGDAARIVAALRGGATPASLNLRSSGRVDDGAEFYFAARLHLGERLFAVARRMADGQVADPMQLPDGIHILLMRHNEGPRLIDYAVARDRVLHDFLNAKVKRLQAGNESFLHRRADIRIAPQLR